MIVPRCLGGRLEEREVKEAGMALAVHVCNLSSLGAVIGQSWAQGQPGLHGERLCLQKHTYKYSKLREQ